MSVVGSIHTDYELCSAQSEQLCTAASHNKYGIKRYHWGWPFTSSKRLFLGDGYVKDTTQRA